MAARRRYGRLGLYSPAACRSGLRKGAGAASSAPPSELATSSPSACSPRCRNSIERCCTSAASSLYCSASAASRSRSASASAISFCACSRASATSRSASCLAGSSSASASALSASASASASALIVCPGLVRVQHRLAHEQLRLRLRLLELGLQLAPLQPVDLPRLLCQQQLALQPLDRVRRPARAAPRCGRDGNRAPPATADRAPADQTAPGTPRTRPPCDQACQPPSSSFSGAPAAAAESASSTTRSPRGLSHPARRRTTPRAACSDPPSTSEPRSDPQSRQSTWCPSRVVDARPSSYRW